MKKSILGVLVVATLSTSAFANSYSRDFNCVPSGDTGVALDGTHITKTKVVNGALKVVSTKIQIKNLSFLIKGVLGTSVPAFDAVTTLNGDGDDSVFSRYTKTTSKRILSINLVINDERSGNDETVVKTTKGNVYTSSCMFDR